MIYLYVVKNTDGTFRIVRTLTSTINQRGNSGITYGDITILDLQTRKDEGFWTQTDVYDNQSDYMMFKEKVTTFDEDSAVVTNTYIFERMPLDEIRNDLKSKVDAKRNEQYYGGFTFENNQYVTDSDSRLNILGVQTAIITDPSVILPDFIWRTMDDQNIPMTADKFKEFALALFQFSYAIFQKSWELKTAIDAAQTYEDIRAAAVWDGVQL